MLAQRILSAAIGVPIILVAVWIGDPSHYPVYTTLVTLAALLAALEFYGLAGRAGYSPLRWLGALLALLFVANGYMAGHFGHDFATPLLAATAALPFFPLLLRPNLANALVDWALTSAGALYTGGLLSYFVLLRQTEQGREWVLIALLVTFAADTAAFFLGRSFGQAKLAPHISPGKTIEGAVGGLVAGILASIVLVVLLGLPASLISAAILGLAIALAALVGDLAESLLKRSVQAKDAGHLIPGHGGLLDRLDSLVFAIIVVYYYAVLQPF